MSNCSNNKHYKFLVYTLGNYLFYSGVISTVLLCRERGLHQKNIMVSVVIQCGGGGLEID